MKTNKTEAKCVLCGTTKPLHLLVQGKCFTCCYKEHRTNIDSLLQKNTSPNRESFGGKGHDSLRGSQEQGEEQSWRVMSHEEEWQRQRINSRQEKRKIKEDYIQMPRWSDSNDYYQPETRTRHQLVRQERPRKRPLQTGELSRISKRSIENQFEDDKCTVSSRIRIQFNSRDKSVQGEREPMLKQRVDREQRGRGEWQKYSKSKSQLQDVSNYNYKVERERGISPKAFIKQDRSPYTKPKQNQYEKDYSAAQLFKRRQEYRKEGKVRNTVADKSKESYKFERPSASSNNLHKDLTDLRSKLNGIRSRAK